MTIATGDTLPLNDQGEQVWPKAGDRAEFVLVTAASSAEAVARRTPPELPQWSPRLRADRPGLSLAGALPRWAQECQSVFGRADHTLGFVFKPAPRAAEMHASAPRVERRRLPSRCRHGFEPGSLI